MYIANCPACGEVVIRAEESSVHVAGPQTAWEFTFRCPVCQAETPWIVPAGAGYVLVAGGAGVTIDRPLGASAPVTELASAPVPNRQTRPLQLDDVIDFHDLITGDGWFDQLIRSVRKVDGPT